MLAATPVEALDGLQGWLSELLHGAAAAGSAAGALTGSALRRVVLTPHVAGVTELSYRRMAQVVAAEARRMRDGLLPTILLNGVSTQQDIWGAQN